MINKIHIKTRPRTERVKYCSVKKYIHAVVYEWCALVYLANVSLILLTLNTRLLIENFRTAGNKDKMHVE